MDILKWFRRKRYEGTQQKISQMQLDVGKYGALSARDTAEREASVLKSLKDSVYNQDQDRIKSLINLFDQLDSQQLEMAEKSAQIKQRITTLGVPKGRKASMNSLIRKIEKSAKDFDDLVKKNRINIENIKASIKDNDFKFAEMLINRAIDSQQDLKKKAIEIERAENQINTSLLSAVKKP